MELKEKLQAYGNALDLAQFTSDERVAWEMLMDEDKDLLWAVWRLFVEADARLPVYRANTRCAAELVKMLGSRPEFRYLADKGKEWLGLAQSDKSRFDTGDCAFACVNVVSELRARDRDGEIRSWVEHFMRSSLGADPEAGFDCTLFTRFVCARRSLVGK